jgi:hypothetical protein
MRKPVYGRTCRLSSVGDPAEVQAGPEALNDFLARAPESDVHIYWHAITFLLTGEADGGDEPLCYLLKGGETIGQTDAGPVRYLAPDEAARFSSAIAEISPDDIGEDRYDLAVLDLNHIYPERWQLDGEENDLLSNLRELYSYFQSMMARAAARRRGVVVSYENTELYFEDDEE